MIFYDSKKRVDFMKIKHLDQKCRQYGNSYNGLVLCIYTCKTDKRCLAILLTSIFDISGIVVDPTYYY